MKFGNTRQEKYDTIISIKQYVHKFVKFFSILCCAEGILSAILSLVGTFNSEVGSLKNLPITIFVVILAPPAGFFVGKLLGAIFGWSWFTVRRWFAGREYIASAAANAASSAIFISYLVGGRKGAKASLIAIIFMLLVMFCIGYYAGLYNLIKAEIELHGLKKTLAT